MSFRFVSKNQNTAKLQIKICTYTNDQEKNFVTGDFFEEWNKITSQTHIRKFEVILFHSSKRSLVPFIDFFCTNYQKFFKLFIFKKRFSTTFWKPLGSIYIEKVYTLHHISLFTGYSLNWITGIKWRISCD